MSAWDRLGTELDAVVLDASRWKGVCDALAGVMGGAGTALIPFDPKRRGPWIVHSDSIGGGVDLYIREGWYARDVRQAAWPMMRARGYATDFDIIDPDVMRRHPYYQDFLARDHVETFVGLHLPTPTEEWVASVQLPSHRSLESGVVETIPRVRAMLTSAVRAAAALSASGLESWLSFFERADRGIALLTSESRVRRMNAAAADLLLPFAKPSGELAIGDQRRQEQLEALLAAACRHRSGGSLPPPVDLPVAPGKSLVFDAMPLPAGLRHFYSDLAAVLVVRIAEFAVVDVRTRLAEDFGLTPAEARLALHIGHGAALRDAAELEAITFETARTRLKTVFAKTGSRRQSELAILVERLSA